MSEYRGALELKVTLEMRFAHEQPYFWGCGLRDGCVLRMVLGGDRIGKPEAPNRRRIPLITISGGLFVGERARPIVRYPHIPDANERIAQLTGAVFGPGYRRLLDNGTMVMDSLDVAAALAVLRAQDTVNAVHWAHELQDAFYGKGRSLSDPATIAGIAEANSLDAGFILRQLSERTGEALVRSNFHQAREPDVSSYPTLLFVDSKGVSNLLATGAAPSALNARLA